MNICRRGVLVRLLALLATAGAGACGGDAEEIEAVSSAGEAHVEGDLQVVHVDSSALSSITIALVESVETTGLRVTGVITYDGDRVSHIGPRIDGRIVGLLADIGAGVRAGQALAILESPEVGQLRADEEEARALTEIARENYDRERRLEEQGISSRRELLVAEAELRREEAALSAARQRLQVLGGGQGQGARYALTAPFAGVVVARDASLGEMASPADQLFTVANLERLWIELDIYERDLGVVAIGQAVDVSTAAYPRQLFPGTISYVGDIMDPEKRTVRARVELPNPAGLLKPGMFATALIQVGGQGLATAAVAQEAVQEVDGQTVVFIPGSLPGEFRPQAVQVGDAAGDGRVLILSGIAAGDRIVTEGAFMLRSELAEGEIGEAGHGH
jgi:cobalt-zinc-cadmium efflux system membrane fusion protein